MSKTYVLIFCILVVSGVIVFINQRPLFKGSAIYKVTTKLGFDKTNKEDCIKLSELDKKSGFIHLAYGRQVKNIIDKFFKKAGELLVFELNLEELKKNGSRLVSEGNKPNGTKYPHLYGTQKIPFKAVNKVIAFKRKKL